MGIRASALDNDDVEELQRECGLSGAQINRLYRRYRMLDKSRTGTLSRDELLLIPELACNPLGDRLVDLMSDNEDQFDFHQFLKALSVFSPYSSREKKMEFAFRIYDVDGDGFISDEDLKRVLKMLVGRNITEEQVAHIATETIERADILDRDGRLSMDEFRLALKNYDLNQHMRVKL